VEPLTHGFIFSFPKHFSSLRVNFRHVEAQSENSLLSPPTASGYCETLQLCQNGPKVPLQPVILQRPVHYGNTIQLLWLEQVCRWCLHDTTKLLYLWNQELMSRPKGGEGAYK